MSKRDEPTFEDAVEAYEAGDAETALDILDGLLPDDAGEGPVEALYLAGECLLDLQEPQEAAHILELALKSEPGEPSLLHAHGVAMFELGQLKLAGSRFSAALEAEPQLAEAAFYLGMLAERSGDLDRARELWASAVARDPENLAMPVDWAEADVRKAWAEIIEEAPEPLAGWWGGLALTVADLPTDEDLQADLDPVSPLVHALFRGGERSTPSGAEPAAWFASSPDSVTVYRRNLGKSALEPAELHAELREALLWETLEFLGLGDEEVEALGLLDD